jgi:hypothetical protein
MRRIGLALRVFFRVLADALIAEQVARLLDGSPSPEVAPSKQAAPQPNSQPAPRKPKESVASEALNLLAAMQREARFVDFIKEPLAAYSDAQIGAAARDVHRDCGTLLERIFALRPLIEASEGAQVPVPAGFDAARYRLTGNVGGQTPQSGKLCHHGWEATRCDLPERTAAADAARVIAPAEVELA